MGILNVLFTVSLMSILMMANMDMNLRMAKVQETQKVDSEVVYMTNELRKNAQNVTGNVNSLKIVYPNGGAINSGSINLKLNSIVVTDQDYYGSGVYTIKLQANFERNNVFGAKLIKRDLGTVYCNDTTNLLNCSATVPAGVVKFNGVSPASENNGSSPCNH